MSHLLPVYFTIKSVSQELFSSILREIFIKGCIIVTMPPLLFAELWQFEWSDTPMWVFDLRQRRMLWANAAGLNLWDSPSRDELIARDFSNLSEATITRNEVTMAEHAAGRTVREQWTVYPKGKPITIQAHSTGVKLDNGHMAILYEAHKIQDAIDPNTLRAVEALQHTNVRVALHKLDGVAILRNPSATRAFGAVHPDLKNDDFESMFSDKTTAKNAKKTAIAGNTFSEETTLLTSQGPRWHGIDVRTVLDPVTGDLLLQINARDISDRRTAEIALEAATKKAEEANRAKGAFLANMSHEIRTPMNAILGIAYLLKRESTNNSQRDQLDKISRAANHLLSLINDILDLSKIESGQFQITQAPFSIDNVIDDLCILIADRIREKKLDVIIDIANIPAWLVGDAMRLRQILINFVTNAIKFTDQGRIVLKSKIVSTCPAQIRIRFEVHDTGIGLTDAQIARLFVPFQQADDSTTRRHGGTGLGLAISRRLAQLMSGEVGVQSTPGQGSIFWIEAPFSVVQNGNRPSPHWPVWAANPPNALVIGNTTECHESIINCLTAFAMQIDSVDTIEQGAQAIARAQSRGAPYVFVAVISKTTVCDLSQYTDSLGLTPLLRKPILLIICASDCSALMPQTVIATDYPAETLHIPFTPNTLLNKIKSIIAREQGTPPHDIELSIENEIILKLRSREKRKILLAEDNPLNQEVALGLLQKIGLIVDVASNGNEAIVEATREKYDLILMDVQMPGVDGLEATRSIRMLPEYKTTPILAMTANAFASDKAECLEAGMNDHIAKPVTPESLYRIIGKWLGADSTSSAPPPSPIRTSQPPPSSQSGRLREQIDRLASVRGLSPAIGLRSVNRDEQGYLRLLRQFLGHHSDDSVLLTTLCSSGQYAELHRLTHTLKSVAAMLGMQPVADQSAKLEALLREQAPDIEIEREVKELVLQLDQIIIQLQKAVDKDPPRVDASLSTTELRQRLKALQERLLNDDASSREMFDPIYGALLRLLGSPTELLKQQIERFSFVEAAQTIEQLLTTESLSQSPNNSSSK